MDPQEPFIRRPEATALLVIDMQNDFLLPDAPLPAAGGMALVPVIAGLQRTRDTPAQVTLGEQVRRFNLTGAFAWTRKEAPPPGIGLVDDVCTTGSTLLAAADAIRAAGGGVAAFLVLAAPVYPAPGTAAGAGQAGRRPAQSLPRPAVTFPATSADSRI